MVWSAETIFLTKVFGATFSQGEVTRFEKWTHQFYPNQRWPIFSKVPFHWKNERVFGTIKILMMEILRRGNLTNGWQVLHKKKYLSIPEINLKTEIV